MNDIYNEMMHNMYDSVIHITIQRYEKLYFRCIGVWDSVEKIP
jgi:hypothetical protein